MKHTAPLIAVREALLQKGWKLATAESCTGGLLAHWITALPGSSCWYSGGVVAYADSTKTALLQVPSALLVADGAVSCTVAAAMARGACACIPEADVAISLTGLAGPAGARPGKPVGLVYLGLALAAGQTQTRKLQLAGSRSEIQIAAGIAALEMLNNKLSEITTS